MAVANCARKTSNMVGNALLLVRVLTVHKGFVKWVVEVGHAGASNEVGAEDASLRMG